MKLRSCFMNLRVSKFCHHQISVEPAIFFAFLSIHLLDILNKNVYLLKTCRFNVTVEPDLHTMCDDENKGILFISTTAVNVDTAFGIVQFLFTIFATIYSDLAGKRRKPFIIIPVVSLILQGIWATLQAYFWYWPSLLGVYVEAVFRYFSGGGLCLIVFSSIYICDITKNENRNVRLTILTGARILAHPIGEAFAGYLMSQVTFFHSFLICIMLSLTSLICICTFVNDHSGSNEADKKSVITKKVKLKDVFTIKCVTESFKIILCTKKPRKHKLAIVLLLALGVLVYFPTVGENSVMYIYTRHRFQWDGTHYSYYNSYRKTCGMIGGILCSLIMSKLMKLHDSIIGLFASLWDTLAAVGFFFADQDWKLYWIPLFDIFHGVAFSSCYSFISKFFEDEQYGRLQSVHWTVGILIILSIPTYNITFQKTMNSFPNAFFLWSIYFNLVVCILYGRDRRIRTVPHRIIRYGQRKDALSISFQHVWSAHFRTNMLLNYRYLRIYLLSMLNVLQDFLN